MNNEFNYILSNAILKCNGYHPKDDMLRKGFSTIYPFTTENINGYIREFDLNNKSLLTLGSSSDQIINSAYFNCNNQTVIDICPYTKYYFYLKKAALIELNYKDFLEYFCYKNFPITFQDNKNILNINIFNKIKKLLKELDNDSYLFWNELYSQFNPIDIRKRLFSEDEDKINVLKELNTYLKDKDNFNIIKNKIENINPTFINDDITNVNINDYFDNIWFSNLGCYHSAEYLKRLLDKYDKNLNINGKILICYLYDTKRDTKFQKSWNSIYDLDKTYEVLNDYITDFVSFIGTKGILHDIKSKTDSVLIYTKTK